MKRSPAEKYTLLFETAKRSLYACDKIASRLDAELAALQEDIDHSIDIGERAITPLITAAAFVDFSHRFGSVVDAMPLVNKKSISVRALRKSLQNVEIARNHLQHIRRDLSSHEQIDYPILGSLSWVSCDCCYTICASQPGPAEYFSIAFDTQSGAWSTACQYTVKRISIDIAIVLRQMHDTYDWLISISEFSDPSISELRWGQTSAIAMRMQLGSKV